MIDIFRAAFRLFLATIRIIFEFLLIPFRVIFGVQEFERDIDVLRKMFKGKP